MTKETGLPNRLWKFMMKIMGLCIKKKVPLQYPPWVNQRLKEVNKTFRVLMDLLK